MADQGTLLPAAALNEDYEVRTEDGEWLRVLSVSRDPRAPTRFVRVHVEGMQPRSYENEAVIRARRPRR